jgi:hypothetical protein
MKNRIVKIEKRINNKDSIALPLFLNRVDGFILIPEYLVKALNIDYSIYEKQTSVDVSSTIVEYKIPTSLEIFSYTSEEWAQDCYLNIKGFEGKRIILFDNGDSND